MVKSIKMYCEDMFSHKEYNIYLEKVTNTTFNVYSTYGKIGGPLYNGQRCNGVSYYKALIYFQKFRKQKIIRGYKIISEVGEGNIMPEISKINIKKINLVNL